MSEETLTQTEIATEDVVLEDSQLVCILTGEIKPAKGKEIVLQSLARMLNEEYGFDLPDMERDFIISGFDPDTGKIKKQKIDLAIFEKSQIHEQDHIIRVCIVVDDKTKENDRKKGVEVLLQMH